MDNISTNLLRFNGEIGPQYLDPDDKTGGPDGTMKPITKDVLREMIMLNLPEIQKVQDEYVKAELESIKQTQQQILQRLNQPINTQLTGSYVKEIVIVKGLEISAGSSVFVGVQNLEDAEYLSFAIRSGKAHDFVATAQRRTSDGLFLDYSPPDRLQLLNVTNKSVALSDRFPVTAPVMMFVVQNNSTETQTYDAYLYKIGSKVM